MSLSVLVGASTSTFAAEPGDLVINEIMKNPSAVADSAGEWFELYNPTEADIDINGWTIEDAGSDSHVISNGGPLLIPAGGFLVLGNNADSATNGGVAIDYSYGGSWFIGNGDDEIILSDDTLTEIDRVEYDGGPSFPDPNGASMALRDPTLDNNVGDNWCISSTPYGDGDLGTPGAANDCPPVIASPIIVNEIMQNPDAVFDSAGEWFELYNTGDAPVDVNGWTIADNDSDSHVIENGSALEIPAGGFLVLGNNADSATNGGVAVDYSYGSTWFLSNGADEVVLFDGDGAEVDRVEYDGGPNFPDPTGASMALIDPTLDNNVGANWCVSGPSFGDGDLGTPGTANECAPPPPEEACGDPITPIYDIQGNGLASPLDGTVVSTEGIVVGDFQDGDGDEFDTDLGGFFIQDATGDGDPATSDGIFVFAPGSIDVQAGDNVRVSGEADEFFDLTQITEVSSVLLCNGGNNVAATNVALPVTSIENLEPYEGMLVTFPQQLHISEFFNFDRFGEIVLTTDRQFQPTAVFEPGSPDAAALAQSNTLSRITLDDGRSNQNPDPARHPNGNEFTLENRFRGGDIVQNVTGVLNYSFGLYRIQPTADADYTVANPRPAQPEDVGGNITVAAFNVLNYFNTIDDGTNDICGPLQDQECRGADDEEERTRQLDKIVSAMATMEADVLGIIEVENTEGVEAMADIVDGLNAIFGPDTYAYVDTGTIGTDAIKVGFIYKTTTVTPVGDFAVLDSDEFVDPNNLGDPKNRPALAQTFMDNEFGDRFTAVVNHFKSKGSPCGPGDDDPQQGNCNLTRTLAAQELADWLATDPTGTGASDVLIIGDLNSYDKEDPIDVLKANGYADLVFEYGGEFAYSFVFDGQLGYLDYAMANQAALSRIAGTTVWHNNTDEPDILDYDTTFKQDAQDDLYEPNAFRSSDHDPVIVGICERPDVVLTPDVLWPANHMYVDVTATVFVDGQAANGNATFVSVTSNEPDNGEDDGDTINDIVQIDDFTFQLRAERSGVGSGRVYTVTYEVLDACDGVQTVSGTVTVPLSLEGGGGRQNNPNR